MSDCPANARRKRALKHERQSYRPHFDVLQSAKEIWNKLRLRTNTEDETRALADKLFELVVGKISDLGKKHDASRVIQAMIQHGTPSQRASIFEELRGDIAELSKSQYSHFIVLKLLKYSCGEPSARAKFVKAVKNEVVKLGTHSVGARIIEVVLHQFSPKETAMLKREFYGKQFALFHDEKDNNKSSNKGGNKGGNKGPQEGSSSVLSELIEEHPDQKGSILGHVKNVIERAFEKKLFAFSYVHELICSYAMHADPADVNDLGSPILENCIELISTRFGASAVAQFAAYSSAKDRKRILKALKGYSRMMLTHRDAYIAVIRLVQVTDDTVTVQKMLLNELLKPVESAANADAMKLHRDRDDDDKKDGESKGKKVKGDDAKDDDVDEVRRVVGY